MSWSANFVDGDGNVRNCNTCTHVAGCQVVKLVEPVAFMLTSVHDGCDGHMATGTARLECNGFEAIPVATADTADSDSSEGGGSDDAPEDGAEEDAPAEDGKEA